MLALVSMLCPVAQARSVLQKKQIARTQFETAEKMRESLNGRPASQRSRKDYDRLVEAYRKVYHIAPSARVADPSILAVAELLAETGRTFEDPKATKAAIGQFQFLCKEYPGSKNRFDALFTVGQLYHDDLGDDVQAKAAFEEFLKRYPHHRLAEKARAAVAEIDEGAKSAAKKSKKQTKDAEKAASKAKRSADPDDEDSAPVAAAGKLARSGDKLSPGTLAAREVMAKRAAAAEETAAQPDDTRLRDAKATLPAVRAGGKLPLLTSIRHWSTPDYTRIAIDLEQEIKYEAGRVPNPDRIFFDLHNTKLASELVGKQFEVGDGFLRKIRVAQFSANLTRVVLEVDSLAEYSAFLLPNPYRLIIDIHGRDTHGKDVPAGKAMAKARDGGAESVTTESAVVNKPSNAAGEKGSSRNAGGAMVAAPSSASNSSEKLGATVSGGRSSASDKAGVAVIAKREDTSPKMGSVVDAPKSAAESGSGKAEKKTAETKTASTAKTDAGKVEGKSKANGKPAVETAEVIAPDTTRILPKPADNGERGPDESDAVATGKLGRQELKTTIKPTTGPTFESVAPRRNDKLKKVAKYDGPAVREAQPTASGDRSLIRALGLKIGKIVVDAGHGGHDTGTIGPRGLQEKDLVLDVALRLGRLLEQRLGAEVIYTREDDTFIPLETRTAVANQNQADLFISVHANSSDDPGARGVETYYLNFTSSADALEVAARENAVSQKSIYELQDLVKKIALKDKIEESREFASDVQKALHTGVSVKNPGIRDRGVKKAPFIVLIGANMPSILAEISFVSNPGDEKRLRTPEYRQKIAESLYRGVARYANGLSGVKVAAKATPPVGE